MNIKKTICWAIWWVIVVFLTVSLVHNYMCIRSSAIKADAFANELNRAYQADSNDMQNRQITRLEILHELIVDGAEGGVEWFLGLVVFLLLSVLWARRRRSFHEATVKTDPGSEHGNSRDGQGRP